MQFFFSFLLIPLRLANYFCCVVGEQKCDSAEEY